ncbi:MAG TPA: YqiA/YcfP family alpha/beta fold hydrolase [Thermoanaerobaculia bacterium]|nr:YqiA/YcfP family alpha/beta fold hydrolase [Thermoanaerobaculia bacterium]
MLPILYLHGFASSPRSGKIELLRPLLEREGIAMTTPDLNVPSFEQLDFSAVVAYGISEARRIAPRAIVGSSLGGLVALEVARAVPAPLVLIAPALGVSDRWLTRIPAGDPIRVFNYARNEEVSIHRRFFEEMSRIVVLPPVAPVIVIMGTDDESVGFEPVERTWREWERSLAAGSRFVTIEGGDHGLTAHVDVIAEAITTSAKTASHHQRGARC